MLEKNTSNVRDIMSTKVIHINENDSVFFILKMFERCRISGAPVMNKQGHYTGVLTKTDFLSSKLIALLDDKTRFEEISVKNIMNHCKPITISEKTSIENLAEIMQEQNIHRVFVEDKNKQIIGVVSTFDLLKTIQKKKTLPVKNNVNKMLKRKNDSYSATGSPPKLWT